ncbi:uncharacterized protein LOC131953006 isoform X1 [Physella acuta]|uniref:uncharacterized protein LOC131953006 isoform X1 n=1 Tax=Physella acuta TaxID=109671 RepID=UPI0027DAE44F|nr:uncharacterized protein LOC131953006 isoform X1 [Physella acuta]
MIVYEGFIFFLFSIVLIGTSDGARGIRAADPFHNRSEQFKPLDEKSCKNLDACLPKGRIPEIFCWQSFEYAYCAYNITQNKDCYPDLVQIAEHLLDVLRRNGEFQRCGYYPDANSVVGFSFNSSRLDLVPCYDFYIYRKIPFDIITGHRFCHFFEDCWRKTDPDCDDTHRQLVCCAMVMGSDKCRKYRGRQSLDIWRRIKEKGDIDGCGSGYDLETNFVSINLKYTDDLRCFDLKSINGFAFSTNTQKASVIKGNSWFVMLAIGIILILVSV